MDRLPDEIILHILSFLEPTKVAQTQQLSRRLYSLAHDCNLWKTLCFSHSRAEARRRRQQLMNAQEPHLVTLREAMNSLSSSDSRAMVEPETYEPPPEDPTDRRARAMANWDPSYPAEQIDYYQDFVQRHAPVIMNWLQDASDGIGGAKQVREAVGMGIVRRGGDGRAETLLAPLDDGGIAMWCIDGHPDRARDRGRLLCRTKPNLVSLRGSSWPFAFSRDEIGAVDNVSVDGRQAKAYIAVFDQLSEVDLETLEVISQSFYPFPINALSEASHPTPLTVGTNTTLHLHDTRTPRLRTQPDHSTRCELIGGLPLNQGAQGSCSGAVSSAHATLPQPGPSSILHVPSHSSPGDPSHEIWVAGRFTSLLTYDRRFWPCISSTLFSGAHLSSLTYLPYPYIHRGPSLSNHLSLRALHAAKQSPGGTLIAAGSYKGKGSLELYSLPMNLHNSTALYRNRQTASKSRLLSVSPHGTRLVFSDGDGTLSWVERDGATEVRRFNINDAAARPMQSSIFAGSTHLADDIVRKIVSTRGSGDATTDSDDLLVWTGDGRLGMVGFGHAPAFGFDSCGEEADDAERREAVRRERAYAFNMRAALERQADEARLVQRLGLGFAM